MNSLVLKSTRNMVVASVLLTFLPLGVQAGATDASPSPKQLLKLIQQQQQQLQDLKNMLAKTQTRSEQAIAAAEDAKSNEPSKSILDKIQIGGAIEIEATNASTFAGADSSDLTLAKVELFFDAQPTDWVSTHVQALFEDGNDNITLDEAWATIGNDKVSPFFVQAGQYAVPLASDETAMVTDPMSWLLAETKEANVLLGVSADGFMSQGYIYNGDTRRVGGGDKIDQFGLFAGYEGESTGTGYKLGVGYISNIGDSDAITTALGGNSGALSGYVGGLGLQGTLSHGAFNLIGGYVTATEAFNSGQLAFNGQGAEPEAWNLEANYTAKIVDRDVTFAVTYQGTDEALALGQPEKRFGGAISLAIVDGATIGAEYLHDEDYGTGDGGTGEDNHTATLQLAIEF